MVQGVSRLLPNMEKRVQDALETGDKVFFDKIKDEVEMVRICQQRTFFPEPPSFFSNPKLRCILSVAGRFNQFELCQFLLMSKPWGRYTERLLFKPARMFKIELKSIAKSLYYWALENKNQPFLDYLDDLFFQKAKKKSPNIIINEMTALQILPKDLISMIEGYMDPCEQPFMPKFF